ncbi:hypothetical protein IWX90DRAFT_411136 [Phyllosticta citrichinensis]|uniref:Uncharacterized protein n=1 Tax=Phyllosticta citrichinensis TaxID=1130410 RepID=A0ABR1Y7W6_9PEZI
MAESSRRGGRRERLMERAKSGRLQRFRRRSSSSLPSTPLPPTGPDSTAVELWASCGPFATLFLAWNDNLITSLTLSSTTQTSSMRATSSRRVSSSKDLTPVNACAVTRSIRSKQLPKETQRSPASGIWGRPTHPPIRLPRLALTQGTASTRLPAASNPPLSHFTPAFSALLYITPRMTSSFHAIRIHQALSCAER